MNNILEESLAELHQIVHDLGAEGGLVSPSIYDSAQVLRFYPPADCRPALDWLLEQQRADGGWGDPKVPHARDVPTLGAMLALVERDHLHPTGPLGFEFSMDNEFVPGVYVPVTIPDGLDVSYLDIHTERVH